MGIYRNENVNSLPEQVQENKENIKQINEILENIDPEQVATILSDIQALKAEQVVQNTAIGTNTQNIGNNITAINNEKAERESVVGVNVAGNTYLKTATPNKQILIDNNGLISITSSTFVEALASNFVRIATDNASVKADENNGVIIEVDSDNPKTLTLKPNGEFEVNNGHILKFDTAGAITIDGQPIGGGGGGSQKYRHSFTLSGTNFYCTFNIINEVSAQYTSKTAIRQLLTYFGFINTNKLLSCVGYKTDAGTIFGIFSAGSTSLTVYLYNLNTSQFETYNMYSDSISIYDTVETL